MQIIRRIQQLVNVIGIFLLSVPMTVSAQWKSPATDPQWNSLGLSKQPISFIIFQLLQWLLFVIGFLAVIAFIISGIYYLTSAGDEKKIETGKTTMIYGIVGVIVSLSGLVIINAIDTWLWGTTAQF